jgi:hypothetical protein
MLALELCKEDKDKTKLGTQFFEVVSTAKWFTSLQETVIGLQEDHLGGQVCA